MKKTHDLVASVGEYTNAAGEKKKRYVTVGGVFLSEDGRESIKLDAVPVGPGWSGWLARYPVKNEERPAREGRRPAVVRPIDDDAEDIPF